MTNKNNYNVYKTRKKLSASNNERKGKQFFFVNIYTERQKKRNMCKFT